MSGGTLYTSAKRPGGQILGGTLCTTTTAVFFDDTSLKSWFNILRACIIGRMLLNLTAPPSHALCLDCLSAAVSHSLCCVQPCAYIAIYASIHV